MYCHFAIPHDLKILKEVFDVNLGEYRRTNAFWTSHGLRDLLAEIKDSDKQEAFAVKVTELFKKYDALSEQYQQSKSNNDIPFN